MVTSHTDTSTCNIYLCIFLLVFFFLITVSQLPPKMLNLQHLPFQNIIHPPFPALRRCIQQTAPGTLSGAALFGEEPQIYKSPCQRRKPSPAPAGTHHPYGFVLLDAASPALGLVCCVIIHYGDKLPHGSLRFLPWRWGAELGAALGNWVVVV